MLAPALALALALQQTEAPPTPAAPPAPPPPAKVAPAPPAPRPPRAPGAKAGPGGERAERQDEPVLAGFDKKSGKKFTGDFEDEAVEDALRQIADAADWSIVLPGGKHGTVTARFKNIPVEDALRAVLQQAGLIAARDGAVVTVRAPSFLPGFPRNLGSDVRRATDDAMREAEKATRAAEKEMRRAEREMRRQLRSGASKGDKVVHGDVVIHADQPARDVVAIRGSVKLEAGAQARDVVAVLGSVLMEPGAHAREAVSVGGSVKVGAGAEVDKDVVSVGGSIERDPGAVIGGEEVSVGIPALSGLAALLGSRMVFDGGHSSLAFSFAQALAKFLVYFALGLLVLALFPRRLDVVATNFTTHPWKSLFTGLLGLVVLPFLLVLLVATVIGIPLVPVAALLVIAAGVLGFTALSFYVGRAVPLRLERATSVLQLAIGTAIVVLVSSIPILGWMVWFAALLLVFGAVLRSRFGSQGGPVLPTTVPPAAPPPVGPPPAAA